MVNCIKIKFCYFFPVLGAGKKRQMEEKGVTNSLQSQGPCWPEAKLGVIPGLL